MITETRTIKSIIPTPSLAVRAAIEGIEHYRSHPNFKFNLRRFGGSYGYICYGCAATAAVQWIAKTDLTPDNIGNRHLRAAFLEFEFGDLEGFECAIDGLRCGCPDSLASYYGFETFYCISEIDPPDENSIDSILEYFETVAEVLKVQGL